MLMNTLKVLSGLAFIGGGIGIIIIAIVPMPFFGELSLITQIINTITGYFQLMTDLMSYKFSALALTAGYIGFSTLIISIGWRFISAGITSMKSIKEKKIIFLGKVKIHFLIIGFILLAVVIGIAFTYFTPNPLSFVIPGLDIIPSEFHCLIPQMFLPIMLMILLITFLYYIGKIFMKYGVKKELIE